MAAMRPPVTTGRLAGIDAVVRDAAAPKAGMTGINAFARAAAESSFGERNLSGMAHEGGIER